MKAVAVVFLEIFLVSGFNFLIAQPIERTKVCEIASNPEMFLRSRVEVSSILLFAHTDYSHLTDPNNGCTFPYIFGDQLKSPGNRNAIKIDKHWRLLKRFLGSTPCGSKIRVARASIRGVIIRTSVKEETRAEKMPFVFVIQAVSNVAKVSRDCTSVTSVKQR